MNEKKERIALRLKMIVRFFCVITDDRIVLKNLK